MNTRVRTVVGKISSSLARDTIDLNTGNVHQIRVSPVLLTPHIAQITLPPSRSQRPGGSDMIENYMKAVATHGIAETFSEMLNVQQVSL